MKKWYFWLKCPYIHLMQYALRGDWIRDERIMGWLFRQNWPSLTESKYIALMFSYCDSAWTWSSSPSTPRPPPSNWSSADVLAPICRTLIYTDSPFRRKSISEASVVHSILQSATSRRRYLVTDIEIPATIMFTGSAVYSFSKIKLKTFFEYISGLGHHVVITSHGILWDDIF